MRRLTIYVAAALAVAVLVAFSVRGHGETGRTGRHDPAGGAAGGPEPAPEPVGPSTFVDGVPGGWRRDEAGARAAAVSAVRLTGRIATAGFITRADIIEAICTSGFGPTLAARSSTQLDELSAELGPTGIAAEALVWSELPLTAWVVSADAQRAEVQVWAVLVAGVPGVGAPRQAWRTVTVTLAWERGDWRIDGWATRAGPTPALAATAVVADVEDVAVVTGWPPADGGG